jgi:cell division protein FtsI (penicillin-binding protein 3)
MKTTKKPRTVTVNVRARLYVVLMVLALGSTALVVRAVDLQVVRKDFYQGQGDARYLREIAMPVSRGMITDRNGEALAVSTPVESIWANPPELLQHPERMPALAHALGLEEQALEEKLIQRSDKEFVYLKRHLNPDDAAAILALEIPGVASQREFRRFYPSGEVLSHVVGFTNIDDRGQEGLELAFDDWLSGKPGAKRVIRDRLGHIVENVELVREPKPGHDLVLSIDRRIQYLAYRELKAAIQLNHAVSGSIVIMDVGNGEVLGMVNQPSFNPNSRGNVEASYRRNRAVTDLIEPGSTIKPFTIAAALESGKWKPESMIDTSPGTLQVADHLVRDTSNHGLLNVTGVLVHSSNVGASKIAATLPAEHMYDMFHRFGFGESTGSGFPGESPGMLPAARSWGTLEKATLSYGYGLSVTPLQIAQAYVALANGGRFRPPTFVRDTQNPDSAILDPQIAHTIVGMLEAVVQSGTGVKARVANYRIGGKTGTSRRAVTGGYESRYFSLFAGMAPASNPRLVAVVVINDPGGGLGGAFSYTGGLVSAPVFSHVMGEALRLFDVPPDNVQQWYAGVADAPAHIDAPAPATSDSLFEEGVP